MNVGRPCAQYRRAGYYVFDHRFPRPLGRRTLWRRGFQPLYDYQHLQGHCNRFPSTRSPLVHTCMFSPLTFSIFAHKLSCTVLGRRPQGKQIIDGCFLRRHHALYCLALQHVFTVRAAVNYSINNLSVTSYRKPLCIYLFDQ